MSSFKDLKKSIIDVELCTLCGTCAGVCPVQCITIKTSPELEGDCVSCGLCLRVCPGKNIGAPIDKTGNIYLGKYDKIFVARSLDEQIKENSSSGGIVSELLLNLLSTGKVDKVSVLDFSKSKPYELKQKSVNSREEIIRAAQSKYNLYPSNTILSEIKSTDSTYAMVALPCQIHALRKLMSQPENNEYKNIKYIIGLYCGLNLHPDATKEAILKLGCKDLEDISKISYRSGKWPGYFKVILKNGKIRKMSKMAFNYLSFLYTPRRCLLCRDLSAEYSDVSVGDAWGYEASSVVVSRTEEMTEFLKTLVTTGKIKMEELSIADAINMHAHGINNKKISSLARIKLESLAGKAVPNVTNSDFVINSKSLFFNKFLLYILNLGKKPLVRRIFSYVPLFIIEICMFLIRFIWTKNSKSKI